MAGVKKIEWSQRYAHGTTSQVSKTRMEIENALKRFGATGFAFAQQGSRAFIMFEAHERRIRFDLPDPRETLAPYRSRPSDTEIDLEERRLWRALLMAVKAKLVVVESGAATFETEFLPYALLPTGQTFAEAAREPSFQAALNSGDLPPMLALGGRR